MTAGGNRADVPDVRPLGIQIGGADQEQPAFFVFTRDCRHHRRVDVAGYQIPKRRRIGHRITEDAAKKPRR